MSEALTLRCRRFALPKKGNSRKEYEDSFAVDCAKGRFAVADGASESIFAGEWAQLLCRNFITDPPDAEKINDWLDSLQQRWLAGVKKQDVPWYIEEKLRDGAFATFLGLSMAEPNGDKTRAYHAKAIGDSCLFHLHGDDLKLSFPIQKAEAFGTRPELIGSRQRVPATITEMDGTFEPGDFLLLMTDALAQWFLSCHEAGKKPWHHLINMKDAVFAEWVDARRNSHRLKNDDVTLLVIGMGELKKKTTADTPTETKK